MSLLWNLLWLLHLLPTATLIRLILLLILLLLALVGRTGKVSCWLIGTPVESLTTTTVPPSYLLLQLLGGSLLELLHLLGVLLLLVGLVLGRTLHRLLSIRRESALLPGRLQHTIPPPRDKEKSHGAAQEENADFFSHNPCEIARPKIHLLLLAAFLGEHEAVPLD